MDKPLIISTKILGDDMKDRIIQNGLSYLEYDAIVIDHKKFSVPGPTEFVIFSSQNAVKRVVKKINWLNKANVLCVGKKSETMLLKNGIKTLKMTKNMSKMVDFVQKLSENASFLHFCGNKRIPLLAQKMAHWGRVFREIIVYETKLKKVKINVKADGILFFSPSGVKSHEDKNDISFSTCFCIGSTTAKAFTQKPKRIVAIDDPSVKNLVFKAIRHIKKNKYA